MTARTRSLGSILRSEKNPNDRLQNIRPKGSGHARLPKKRERSIAHLLVKQCRELELGVDEILLDLFGKKKEVEQPKMELW